LLLEGVSAKFLPRIALAGSHSNPKFDKLIPLIEHGAVPGFGIPSVRDRIERFVGA
jgi:hypothetical protein